MRINDAGLGLIKSFEGCELTSYRCPAGVWTLGYGSTGPDIKAGMTWTLAQAEDRLRADLRKFERAVEALVDGKATPNQFSALVCFAYNVGVGALTKSTLLKRHKAGDHAGAAAQFMAWNKARVNGQLVPLKGLTRRRQAEADLYRKA